MMGLEPMTCNFRDRCSTAKATPSCIYFLSSSFFNCSINSALNVDNATL